MVLQGLILVTCMNYCNYLLSVCVVGPIIVLTYYLQLNAQIDDLYDSFSGEKLESDV